MRLVDTENQFRSTAPQALVSAIQRLAGAHTQEDVIETLRTTARNVAGADGICIVLRDNGKCHYIEEEAISPLWKGGKFPLETCISGWAMMNNKTVVIPDVFADDRIPHAIYRQTFVKSLVMTPIGSDEPIAALGAYWSKNYLAPKEVVETLETLARAAATALENAHLISVLSESLRKMELAREELKHRLKNSLAAVKSFGEVALSQEQSRALANRVDALSRAHALLGSDVEADAPVLLGDLVKGELAPYLGEAIATVDISGPEITVSGDQAIALGLALNELALNAARSGLLISAKARLAIHWREESRVVMIEWAETGGPAARQTASDGLNTLLIKKLINGQLKGNLRGALVSGGVTCFIEFPNETAREFPANTAA